MELRKYGVVVLSWWWLLLLCSLLAGGVAWLVSVSQPKIYRASALLQVNANQPTADRGFDFSLSSVSASQQMALTYAELANTPAFLEAAAERLGLPIEVLEEPGTITIKAIRDTQILDFSVENEDPQTAANYANAIAELFIEQHRSNLLAQTSTPREVIREQINAMQQEVLRTSSALDAAVQGAGSASPEGAPNRSSSEITRLQELLVQQQSIHSNLVRSEAQLALIEAQTVNSLKLAAPARPPRLPIWPKVELATLIAALVGLLFSMAIVFLKEYLDDRVRGEQDVADATGHPPLAAIGQMHRKGTTIPRLLDESEVRSEVGEAFRTLRSNLYFAWREPSAKAVVVTSPNPGEGKTTTSVNLALMLARDGRRVILVDADLRKPGVHRAFGLGQIDSGLSTILADPNPKAMEVGVPGDKTEGSTAVESSSVASYLVPTRILNLYVLPAGPIPANPSELLGSPRFEKVLRQLKTMADVIVLDSPPLLSVVDPMVIAGRADGVILVAEAGRTQIAALSRATQILERGSARSLGVVFNKQSERSPINYIHHLVASLKRKAGKAGSPIEPQMS